MHYQTASKVWLWATINICFHVAKVEPDSSSVYVLNQHLQLVTSTSLKWVSVNCFYPLALRQCNLAICIAYNIHLQKYCFLDERPKRVK